MIEEVLDIKKSIDKLNEDIDSLEVDIIYLKNLDWHNEYHNYRMLNRHRTEILELVQNKVKTKKEAIKILNRQLEEIDEKIFSNY
jgi:broad-specificity NMP kinase